MDSPFIQYVKKVLDSWTALRIAEQQSTAGRDTKARIQALVPYINQNLEKQTDQLEVAGWLEDYFSEKLNMDLDDNSQDTVAKLIVEAYALQRAGKNQEILGMISKVPAGCDLSQCQFQEDNPEVNDYDTSEDDNTADEDDISDDDDMDTD
ncbi:unnamed protein product [Hymenolepis diminuta]|uniref:Pre-rRNA-processing protein TSR2 homolog n=1 Tax=Hymenolepis diminuta TaxID=6216 RepID=A0A0R3SCF9_HYMDI|nr:unnamed protein product [Hymenolepis diminuta]VUZ40966.1 unnamed protein product [Hymenolepis diminuta]